MKDIINQQIQNIFNTTTDIENTTKIPNAINLRLMSNHAKNIDTTVLYIDLRGYSKLFENKHRATIAKVITSYHHFVTKIVNMYQGQVISFMGDGILVIYEPTKCVENAVTSALKIKFYFENNFKKILAKYHLENLSYGIGISSGSILAVRGGIKEENDISWIGSCVKDAVKIGDELNGEIGITNDVYNILPMYLKNIHTPNRLFLSLLSQWYPVNQTGLNGLLMLNTSDSKIFYYKTKQSIPLE